MPYRSSHDAQRAVLDEQRELVALRRDASVRKVRVVVVLVLLFVPVVPFATRRASAIDARTQRIVDASTNRWAWNMTRVSPE